MNQELLKSEFLYDPETGKFTFLAGANSGKEAGSRHSCGYRQMYVQGSMYYAHRLAWLYMTGSMPAMKIDHIDGDRMNNRFSNLREVSDTGNQHNQRKPHKNGTTGFLGVSKKKGRFRAAIKLGRKTIHIGTFDSPEEAHEAYLNKKREVHSACTI